MKKTILLLCVIIGSFACSKGDDTTEVSPDPELPNKAPSSFSLLAIEDNAEEVDLSLELSWEESIDPEGDDVKYDIYLNEGTVEPGSVITSNINSTSYSIENLEYYTEYSWKVVAKDNMGEETSSEIFSFITRQRKASSVLEDASFPERSRFAMVNFNDRMWIIDGIQESDVWSSANGIDWEEVTNVPIPGRLGHAALVFNNKIWIIGGNGVDNSGFQDIQYNDIWSSTDGVNWELETEHAAFSARYSHTAVVFEDKMWIIGGENGEIEYNDVWSSSDGINWTKETDSADFLPRYSHSSFIFQDQIWVIGGVNSEQGAGEGLLNDVWSSSDGKNWNVAVQNAPFSNRFGHTSKVYNDKIVLIGGRPEEGASINDIWVSTDGTNWKQQASNANFPERRNHSSLVFMNKLWIVGGTNRSDLSDVWYLN